MPLHCINGLPWAYAHGPINLDERDAGRLAVEDFRDNVMPHLGPRRLSVLTADNGFHDQTRLRPLLHQLGIVPNIHPLSHAEGRASTDREVTEAERLQFDLDGKPGWYVDGFREPHHRCGKTKHPVHTYRRIEQVSGRAVTRVEAACKHCNTSITITAGQWKKVRDTTGARTTRADSRSSSPFTPATPTTSASETSAIRSATTTS